MSTLMKTLAIIAFLQGTASIAAPSYPMVCRGGKGTLGVNGANNSGVFYFTKAPNKAGQGLQAGECAWLDRAIGSNEPPCLQQYGANAVAWIFPERRADSYISSSTGRHWMRDMLSPSHYQRFQAYNPGNGCFVVTKVGL